MIQALTGVVYEVVSSTWMVASVAVKYYLVYSLVRLYRGKGLTRKRLAELFVTESRLVLTGFVVLGAVFYVVDVSFSPLFRVFSELVALTYLGFLFWKY
ncbi:MAG: hypothetical protein ABEJ95_00685 [Candidatus Nanohalobium sp.]